MSKNCPLCRLPIRQVGRLVAFKDSAGKCFVFEVCSACSLRLDRLPVLVQKRQFDAAVSQLDRHPNRYLLRAFPDEHSAHLFVHLEAERLRYGGKEFGCGH